MRGWWDQEPVCLECAELCEICANECRSAADPELSACAEVCRTCAQGCRRWSEIQAAPRGALVQAEDDAGDAA